MRPTLFAITVLALLAIAAMPPASAAVHGVAWDATGVAVNTAGDASLMTLHFSGNFGFLCATTYTVTLKNAAGAVVQSRTFTGFENQVQTPGQNYVQESFADSGGSTDGAVSFAYTGYMFTTTGTYSYVRTINQVLVGHYQDLQFTVLTVAELFDFNCHP